MVNMVLIYAAKKLTISSVPTSITLNLYLYLACCQLPNELYTESKTKIS